MSNYTVITGDSFARFLNDSVLNSYLSEMQQAFSKIGLLKLESIASGHVFNGQGLSLEHFHSSFFPQLLEAIYTGLEEACTFISDFIDIDVEEYFEFLSESGYADLIFEDLNLDLNTEFSNFLELYNAYNAVMSFAPSFDEVALIPEGNFTDYVKSEAVSLGIVQNEYANYFDFEKLADNWRIDYKIVNINAPNTLRISGDCYIRA